MKIQPIHMLVIISALVLSACQTTNPNTITSNDSIGEMPTITVAIDSDVDSDGDGAPDEIDECPATPYNMVVDERGCPFAPIGTGLKMEYRAFFAKGSSELSPEYQMELDKIVAKMNEYDKSTFRIEAHASEDEINKELSSLPKNRASIIKNYLMSKHSIVANRLTTADCGAKAPIASDEKDLVLNRRVYGLLTEPEEEKAYQNSNSSESATCVEF